jgi:hypothetical protein
VRPILADAAPPINSAGPIYVHAAAWSCHADALAAWTDRHLVNRRDAFGHYIAIEDRKDPDLTAWTDKSGLTLEVLARHYRGASTGDLIGLHSTARDDEAAACWSRWLGVDIDRHDEGTDPEATWRAALAWCQRAEALGFQGLLIDSNGRGGYHLLLLFDGPTATEKVFAFGKWLTRDWKDLGLAEAPETFPKQASIKVGGFGNWLRLPGRHHTRDHWSRVWDGEAERWLEGTPAIKAILATVGTPTSAIPAEALAASKPAPRARRKKAEGQLGRDAELARQALGHLGDLVDDYHGWLKVGMSLTPLGADGLALWDDWSRHGPKYQEGACERKWRSFRPDGGLTLGTLFQWAKDRGWEGQGRSGPPPSHQGARNGIAAMNGNGRTAVDGQGHGDAVHAAVHTESFEVQPRNDLGNARRLVHLHGADLHYVMATAIGSSGTGSAGRRTTQMRSTPRPRTSSR